MHTRVREFYAMSPDEAYNLLKMIAKINGLEGNLKLWKKSKEADEDEKAAKKIAILRKNRHHFKDIDFVSSLTGKKYHGTTNEDGTLKIIDTSANKEIVNNSHPSKKEIIGQAIIDLGGKTTKDETLYQRYHKLTKILLESKTNH